MKPIKVSDPRAAERRIYFTCVDTSSLQTRLQASDMSGTFTVYLSKNGGTPVVPGVTSVVQIDATNQKGAFYLQLAAADIDTVGQLLITIKNSGGTKTMEPREIALDVVQAYLSTVSSATTASITCDRSESTTDYFKDALVTYLTGALKGQVKKIGGYTTGVLTLPSGFAFTGAGANGDVIEILTA